MTKTKSKAIKALERAAGGPLTLGMYLRSIRLGEDESVAAFASKLGVSRQNLCDIEQGRRTVSVQRAAEWAELLGYHPGQFVELALQAAVDAAHLPFRITAEAV